MSLQKLTSIAAFLLFSYGHVLGLQPVCEDTHHYYPDQNCSIFYHCTHGYPQVEECPGGLYWNTRLDTCDFPMNVPECIGGTRPPPTTTTTTEIPSTPTPSTTNPTTTTPTTTTTTTPTTTTPTTTTTTTTTPTTTTPTTTTPTTTTPTTPTTTTPTTTTPTTTTPTTTTPTTTTPTTTTPTTTPPNPGCGGILTSPRGIISYKPFINYDNNERCVWTIHIPTAISIVFHLDTYSSNPDPYDGVLVSGFKYNGSDQSPLYHTHVLTKQGDGCSVQNQELLVVIFFTDESRVRTGFQLNYTATVGSAFRQGRHVILSNTHSQTVTHPTSGNYANSELSTFVYAPQFSHNPSGLFRTTFSVKGLEAGHDFVFAYILNLRALLPWTLQKRLGHSDNGYTFLSNDIVLLVFESDYSRVNTGFTLSFEALNI